MWLFLFFLGKKLSKISNETHSYLKKTGYSDQAKKMLPVTISVPHFETPVTIHL